MNAIYSIGWLVWVAMWFVLILRSVETHSGTRVAFRATSLACLSPTLLAENLTAFTILAVALALGEGAVRSLQGELRDPIDRKLALSLAFGLPIVDLVFYLGITTAKTFA